MTDFLQITTTASTGEEADRLATSLVERRLASCVQIVGPVRSVYRWHGVVERADEWLLLIKTRRDAYTAVEAAIRELHSYECPEIIATPVEAGSAAYLQWLADQLS
jgi:periplasmic divalent cation tolerance protein